MALRAFHTATPRMATPAITTIQGPAGQDRTAAVDSCSVLPPPPEDSAGRSLVRIRTATSVKLR